MIAYKSVQYPSRVAILEEFHLLYKDVKIKLSITIISPTSKHGRPVTILAAFDAS